jgi:hypothetical protein
MRIYRREGIGHTWLVNPITRTLEVYRLESGHWMLVDTFEGDAVVRAEPFDATELELGLLWER